MVTDDDAWIWLAESVIQQASLWNSASFFLLIFGALKAKKGLVKKFQILQ